MMSKPKIVVPQGISGGKERSRRPALDAIERRTSNWMYKVRSKALIVASRFSKIDSDFPADAMEACRFEPYSAAWTASQGKRNMANVVVVGSQWGDEGKGKIVDWLSERADVVVRFQGGHNAGHTLVVDGKVYKLSLLPSGVVRPGKLSVIGNGVVVDPHALVAEIDRLAQQGVEVGPQNLRLADNAALILSVHREL